MKDIEREFVGLFWGEGSIVSMARQEKKGSPITGYRLTFQIHMRVDDLLMLQILQKEFGGKIYHKKGRIREIIEHPSCYWMIFRREECERMLLLLENAILPSKKKMELVIARELFEIKPEKLGTSKFGGRYSLEQRHQQRQLHDKLKASRIFRD